MLCIRQYDQLKPKLIDGLRNLENTVIGLVTSTLCILLNATVEPVTLLCHILEAEGFMSFNICPETGYPVIVSCGFPHTWVCKNYQCFTSVLTIQLFTCMDSAIAYKCNVVYLVWHGLPSWVIKNVSLWFLSPESLSVLQFQFSILVSSRILFGKIWNHTNKIFDTNPLKI
jgi:hypothetical protein